MIELGQDVRIKAEQIDNLNSIIESGSNANGYYEKLSDGTLKQWGVASSTEAQKSWVEINFPVSFKSVEDIVLLANNQYVTNQTNSVLIGCVPQKSTVNIAYVYLRTFSGSNPTYILSVHWLAIGKWK